MGIFLKCKANIGDISTALKLNKQLIPWIVEQHKNGAEVATLCIGAFILASTGLLGI